jgi:hypothetical protein
MMKPLSFFAFNFNVRRYDVGDDVIIAGERHSIKDISILTTAGPHTNSIPQLRYQTRY